MKRLRPRHRLRVVNASILLVLVAFWWWMTALAIHAVGPHRGY